MNVFYCEGQICYMSIPSIHKLCVVTCDYSKYGIENNTTVVNLIVF